MYLKRTPQKNGRIYISIVDNYYDKEKKRSNQVTLEKIGYLDELEKLYEDPITLLTQKVKKMKEEKALNNAPICISFSYNETIMLNANLRKNFGYVAISKIYHQLEIHTFLNNKQRHSKELYDANAIMKMMVFQRLLEPGSKLKSYENRNRYFENSDFTIDDVYRSLSLFDSYKDTLMLWLHEHVKKHYERDTSLVYYDVTNYYFEIDGSEGYEKRKKKELKRMPDGFRKKGVSKEHRPDPIVQMGLFIDNKGLPITYKLFPGNTNDCLTYRPNLSDIKIKFGLKRAIVVADKGMNTGDNIWYTLSAKDGYVFSMTVRGANKEIKKYVLDERGYEWKGTDYKRKSKLSPRKIQVTTTSGKKVYKEVHEKQVAFYSKKYDLRAKAEREIVIAKAKDLIKNPSKYNKSTSYGAAGYIKNITFDKNTGEIIDTEKLLELNMDKLKEEEKYDGYYMIVTSELRESNDRIIEMYRGLWKIEEAFRVTKSDLQARPVYVSRKDRIEGHFLSCFISLLMARIMEMTLKYKYSVGRILESLRKAECTYLKQNYYLFDYYDEVLADIGSAYGIDFSKRIRTLREIKKISSLVKK
jgi:transposase